METAVQWAGSICISAGVVCIVEMFISDTAVEKTVRYVLGAFMLCAVIIPLGNVVNSFSADLGEVGEISQEIPREITEQRTDYLKDTIKKLAENYLAEEKIFPCETKINMDIDSSNSISIITADIFLERTDIEKKTKVKEILRDKLGIESDVSVRE